MEIGAWTRRCDNSSGNCVEVMDTGTEIVVRDRYGAWVTFDHREWDSFLAGVGEGVFTRTGA
jgi:hypothetical protein